MSSKLECICNSKDNQTIRMKIYFQTWMISQITADSHSDSQRLMEIVPDICWIVSDSVWLSLLLVVMLYSDNSSCAIKKRNDCPDGSKCNQNYY